MAMPINQPIQVNGIRYKVFVLAHMLPHDKVALQDREGTLFADKGCPHVPWQAVAVDRGITRDPQKCLFLLLGTLANGMFLHSHN